ncbi:pyridoxal-phosphate dependent enzyme [Azospirillum halopraeferens]|uniref:pyridoxal-phosphate dependent enzyme n=1 Tax=Azospirillum halopraeferens TaxID=34010 RepID=UPI0004184793|nr:pyridoxal-phosphate dependent enzyme [Azospirillum halopraeferens]
MFAAHAVAVRHPRCGACSDRSPRLPAWLPSSAISAAAARLAGQVVRTPLLDAPGLGAGPGIAIGVKVETFQATGAFKERGALNRLLRLTAPERAQGVVAMSAGNHAAGLALHGARLGVPVTIVMPVTAPRNKVERTAGYGAEVLLHGATVAEARDKALELAADRRLTFVHPYDDPDVIAGQGTVGLEILEDRPDTDLVVVPVGGGGLLAGVAAAVKARNPSARVVGVRHARFRPGGAGPGPTLADGIAVADLGKLARAAAATLVDAIVYVEEDELAHAVRTLHRAVGIVAEGAGAAAVAALLAGRVRAAPRTVAVVSGRNVDAAALTRVLEAA